MQKTTVVILKETEGLNPQTKINFKPMQEYAEIASKTFGEQIVLSDNDTFPEISGTVILIKASLPLITEDAISAVLSFHEENNNKATVVTVPESKEIGICIFDADEIKDISLSDIGSVLAKTKDSGAFIAEDKTDFLCVRDRVDVAIADKIIRERVAFSLMLEGVTVINPENTYIESGVKVGFDTVIYPGTVIEGNSKIGEGCILYPNCAIKNCTIGDRVEIKSSTLVDSTIGSDVTVGPYAYVRPGSEIGNHTKIGDFVEVKKAKSVTVQRFPT